MKHRQIQQAHEESVLKSFEEYHRRLGKILTILDRPDPPDAIVAIDNKRCWIEITDAFQSSDWAQSITSYAADDKDHKPYQSRLLYNPDQQACQKVKEVIFNKVQKKTMANLAEEQGKGILLVGCYTPLTTPQEIIDLARDSIIEDLSCEKDIFKSIFLYSNTQNGHAFFQFI